ncbi:MAG TPA: alpha/beta hydrolase-fold protein [Cyclobacteriaceae bacterium]|nr:alpha/beta hydrolase-fold protein [Cyclobacteriaceae bacterium]
MKKGNRTFLTIFIAAFTVFACGRSVNIEKPLTEFSNYYSDPTSEKIYSEHVQDTFRLFKSTPLGYNPDSARIYPLIIILDANAFYESTLAELKFNGYIGQTPKAVVVGVGYRNFQAMDSLRSRDYTYPVAIPEYEMSLSGGADRFKKFIDLELIPKLTKEYKIDMDQSVICGHSLGGYFTLYYGLKSIEENSFTIKNIVSASPSLHYNHRYLFEMEKNLHPVTNAPLNFYISMGSEDMADDESQGILEAFGKQIRDGHYPDLKIETAEYSNFGHIDAAVPGFMKGLNFVFQKK